MAYQIKWLIENRIIYSELRGQITLQEAQESNKAMLALLDQSTASDVYIIVDDSALENIPVSLKGMKDMFTFFTHPKLGWMLAIGERTVAMRLNSTILSSIFHLRHKQFVSYQEAIKFIIEQEPDLKEKL